MGIVTTFINNAADFCGISGYSKDRKIAARYANAELTREQYDSYKDKLKLRREFNREKRDRYYHLGMPRELSSGKMMKDIIVKLAEQGVMFEKGIMSEPTNGEEPVDLMAEAMSSYAQSIAHWNNHWFDNIFPAYYAPMIEPRKRQLTESVPKWFE